MELSEAIKTRRSIRNFSNRKIDAKILEDIIEAGIHAPSHCNTQGWKFIYVNDKRLREKIFNAGGSFVINDAPYGLLVLYNKGMSDNLEYFDWIQSGSAAIQNILLRIHDLGLGGCWICHLPIKKTLSRIFKIKSPYTPVAYIAFGYPSKEASEIPRKSSINDFYSLNRFDFKCENTPTKIIIKRILKHIYFKLPGFIKILINPLTGRFVKKFEN